MTVEWLLEHGLVTPEQVAKGKQRIRQWAERVAQADKEELVLWLTSGQGLD